MPNATETLKFKIGLSGTFFDKIPAYSILLNGEVKDTGEASSETKYIEFSAEVSEDKEYLLEIRLTNKTQSDTIENEDKTAILKDMLLNIDSIEIDEIDLDSLRYSNSEFVGDDPSRPVLDRCVNLGWNGSYKFKFSSPFYLWLLENM